MGFVLIAEPDEIHAAGIRAILDGVEKDFEYELAISAEAAIEVLDRRKPEVFIGAMEMSVMTGQELFSLVEMISPETVRIIMADGKKIRETVDFINVCSVFKIVIKPCRLAEDLLIPIDAGIAEHARRGHEEDRLQLMRRQEAAARRAYNEIRAEWSTVARNYGRMERVLTELLRFNTGFGDMGDEIAERVRGWYEWVVRQYIKTNIEEAYCAYEKMEEKLVEYGDDSMNGQAFQIKNNCKKALIPEQCNEIYFIVILCVGCCKAVLKRYDMKVRIEEVEKAYILRLRCTLFRDWTKPDKPVLYRERNENVRKSLYEATGHVLDSFGYQSVQLEKGDDTLMNIAIPKRTPAIQ